MSDPGRIPGPLVAPQTVQCRLAWTLTNSKTVYNVMHGSVAGGFVATAAMAEAIHTAIKAAAGWTNWKAKVGAGTSLAGFDIRDLRAANMALMQSNSAASAGTGAGGAIPPGDALCITLRTANAGRSMRGRLYLPGLDFSALAAGGVLAGGNDALAVAFVTAVQTAMTAQGITLAIPQFARAAYVGTTNTNHAARAAAAPVPVTSIVCRNTIIDHQRRRAGRS